MPTSYTSLLGLALPVTGELSGTWGDVVSNYITQYVDSAVAGTQTISGSQTAVTLSVTNGSSLVTAGSGATGSAQFQIINCTGNPAGLLTITAPASSRQYIIINATSTSQSVKIVGVGPTTGVTLISGEKAHVAWNGSDFVKIATTAAAGGSNTQVQYNSSGVLAGSSNLTFDGTNLTVGGTASATKLIPTGGAATGNGMYLPAANELAWSNNGSETMRLNSTGLGIGTSSPSNKLQVNGSIVDNTSGGYTQFTPAGFGALVGGYAANNTANLWLAGGTGNNGNQVGHYINSVMSGNGGGGGSAALQIGQIAWSGSAFTSGTAQVTLDSSGNLGLGVTPSAWYAVNTKAFQIGASSSVNDYSASGNRQTTLANNAYLNASAAWTYSNTDPASRYHQTGGQHQWYTAASGTAGNTITFTQAMTLDASSRLLVGTTTAGIGANANTLLTVGGTNATTYQSIKASGGEELILLVGASEIAIGAYSNNYLAFRTNNTERARITSGGDLLVGTTTASNVGGRGSRINCVQSTNGSWIGGLVHSATTGTNAFGLGISYSASSPNSSQNPMLFCEDSTALRAEIRSNGGLANYSANDANLSDRREKTNFAPAKSYLDTICAIPVQTFNYIDQSPDDPGLTLGVVAQDVQAVAPELVMESNWGTQDEPKMRLSIYQTDLQYALMKCIQEQQALIQSLTARVAALESKGA